jgi:hypothetical protein
MELDTKLNDPNMVVPIEQSQQQPPKREGLWQRIKKLDKSKIIAFIVITVLVICVVEALVMKHRSKTWFEGPQTYVQVYVYVDSIKHPVIIYNKHNITDADKRMFKQYKYKTTPKILIGDKTAKIAKDVKEQFSNITSINGLIDGGLTTLSEMIMLKQPIESKYRVISNVPINNVFTDGKRIYFK